MERREAQARLQEHSQCEMTVTKTASNKKFTLSGKREDSAITRAEKTGNTERV